MKMAGSFIKFILKKNRRDTLHVSVVLIEQGVDDDGRKFYKIYFEEES